MLAVFAGSDGSYVLSLLADDDIVIECVSGLLMYVALQGEGQMSKVKELRLAARSVPRVKQVLCSRRSWAPLLLTTGAAATASLPLGWLRYSRLQSSDRLLQRKDARREGALRGSIQDDALQAATAPREAAAGCH